VVSVHCHHGAFFNMAKEEMVFPAEAAEKVDFLCSNFLNRQISTFSSSSWIDDVDHFSVLSKLLSV
jgi:hypothetical protein